MLVANILAPIQMPIMPTGGAFNQTVPGGLNRTRITESPEYRQRLQSSFAIQTSIQRISPANLYSEAASSILGIIGGSSGFMGPGGGTPFRQLELTQSLTASWPQVTAIAVGLVVSFAASYMLFLRLEIRPGG